MLKEFRGHKASVLSAVYNEDNSHVISASADGHVKVWDVRGGECVHSFVAQTNNANQPLGVSFLGLVPKRFDVLVLCTRHPTAKSVNAQGVLLQSFTSPGADLVSACVSSKGKFVYFVGDDKVIYCFEAESGKLVHAMKAHTKDILGFVHHPHYNISASFSEDGTIKLWK
jgi:WD40 repeat-containing protein SMU1